MTLPWGKAIGGVWDRPATELTFRPVQGRRSTAQPEGRSKLRVTQRSVALPCVDFNQPNDKNPRSP